MTDMLDVGLDDWLDADIPDPSEPWEIEAQADADKLLWALRSIERRRAEDAAVAEARIAEIREWQDARVAALDERRAFLERRLEGWARMRHAVSGGREVTWKLAGGELKLRPAQTKCEVDRRRRDGEDSIARVLAEMGWANVVKIEHKVMKGDAKKIARPGAPLPIYPAPDGYVAHQAVVGDDEAEEGYVEMPGVVLLVPAEERTFSAVPKATT